MKKIFTFLVVCLISSLTMYAQNNYVSASFGSEIGMKHFTAYNLQLGIKVGCFIDAHDAIEVEYTHGFKRTYEYESFEVSSKFDRIGLNFVHEFPTSEGEYVSPYVKCGFGYKIILMNHLTQAYLTEKLVLEQISI